uniref:GT23 domain-containing protein n=1 Tax=Cyclophora tenuis TaxID=216820 RepID=A0A7S1GND3_CYCTE
MWCSGWGADFINVVYGLMNAVEFRRPLAFALFDDDIGWHYSAVKGDGSHATCPKKDLSCYFLPLTRCTPRKEQTDTDYPNITQVFEERYVAVYNYATRPYQWLRREVYNFVAKLEREIVTPCAVIHVRRTDVVLHGDASRKYYPVSAYVDLLPQDRRDHIFLLTDDADAIDEAHEFFPNTNWHYIERKRFRGTEGGWENQIPSKNPKQEVITILGTFQLAQRCDTFVHGHSVFSDEIYRAMTQSPNHKHIARLRVDANDNIFSADNVKSVKNLQKTLQGKRKEKNNNDDNNKNDAGTSSKEDGQESSTKSTSTTSKKKKESTGERTSKTTATD